MTSFVKKGSASGLQLKKPYNLVNVTLIWQKIGDRMALIYARVWPTCLPRIQREITFTFAQKYVFMNSTCPVDNYRCGTFTKAYALLITVCVRLLFA